MKVENTKRTKAKILFGLVVIMTFCFVKNSRAETFFVDFQSGNNSNTGTSFSVPWKNCPGDPGATNNVSAVVPVAGDTVCFRGGIQYSSGNTITIKSSGTSENRIVYDGNCANFGNGNRAIFTKDTNFYVRSRDYVTIKNIEFVNFSSDVVWQDYQYYPDDAIGVMVENCYIHDGWVPQ